MDTPNTHRSERYLAGVKAAALIVIIGAMAIAADQAFFIEANPGAPAEAVPSPPAVSSVQQNGFAFADALRPTEADREPTPPSF